MRGVHGKRKAAELCIGEWCWRSSPPACPANRRIAQSHSETGTGNVLEAQRRGSPLAHRTVAIRRTGPLRSAAPVFVRRVVKSPDGFVPERSAGPNLVRSCPANVEARYSRAL